MSGSQEVGPSLSDEIDWTSIIRDFGRQHDMGFTKTLQWIGNRSSLQVVCEVLGVDLSPALASRYTETDLDILYSLGDFLWTAGYNVPRLMENRRLEYRYRGQAGMGFSLSREEYLRERATGKSKNKIAHQQGISGPALFHWLNKWGLKDIAVEEKEIELLKVTQKVPDSDIESVQPLTLSHEKPPASSAPVYPITKLQVVSAEASHSLATLVVVNPDWVGDSAKVYEDTPANTSGSQDVGQSEPQFQPPVLPGALQVQLSMPLVSAQLPETIRVAALSRDQRMQTALSLMQGAVGQAYRDLAELLGEEAAGQQIQQYIEHQVKTFLSLPSATVQD